MNLESFCLKPLFFEERSQLTHYLGANIDDLNFPITSSICKKEGNEKHQMQFKLHKKALQCT